LRSKFKAFKKRVRQSRWRYVSHIGAFGFSPLMLFSDYANTASGTAVTTGSSSFINALRIVDKGIEKYLTGSNDVKSSKGFEER
jgi:hypothetical protein